jgi:hypothetical protein
MDIVVLILAAIFFFVVAVLFRSNEALDRVGEVEKEVALIEKDMPQEEEKHADAPKQAEAAQEVNPTTVPVTPKAGDPAFPNPENVHMN